MKTPIAIHSLRAAAAALALGLFLLPATVSASAGQTFVTCPNTRHLVKIEGTSTMHDWTVQGRFIEGKALVDAEALLEAMTEPGKKTALRGKLEIPGQSLRSFRRGRPYSSRMDGIMHEKLLVETHPRIRFELETVKPLTEKPEHLENSKGMIIEATGKLSVAGVEKAVKFPLTVSPAGEGGWKIEAKTELKMTDFNIDPPVALAGAIRTGDEVTVEIEWTVIPEPAGS